MSLPLLFLLVFVSSSVAFGIGWTHVLGISNHMRLESIVLLGTSTVNEHCATKTRNGASTNLVFLFLAFENVVVLDALQRLACGS